MGLLDSKIAIIRDNVYGEEIRTAIYEAFDMLDDESVLGKLDSVPTASEISSMIESAMSGMDIGSGTLSFKGILANGAQLNRYALNIDRKYSGIYVLGPSRSYSNLPSDFPSNANGILVNINTNDDEDVRLDAFVQIVYPLGQSFDGLYWIRTDVDEGWKAAGGGSGSSGLATKGILPDNTNLASFGTVENEGIYRTNTSYNYSSMPTGYDNSKVSILKNYVFTNSSGTVTYRIQELSYVDGTKTWIRGKTGTTNFVTSDWKEVAGSGSGGTINPQDVEDAVFDYLEHDADLNQIIADYIGDQGSVDEATVKGWIEGYVDKDNSSDHDGQTKFNASVNALIQAALSGYSTTDRTYSSDVNQAVTGFLTANSDLSDANKEYITNARSEYTTYNDTVKPSVADGVVGLAAFRMAIQAIKPARSGGEVENSIRSLYATTRDATKPIGWATDWANAYDLAGLMPLYNTYYASGDARSELNPLTKAAIADGMLGFAAFKRTEWYPTPQMYGAKADGVTDDHNAIQRAINANRGKTLYFPAGTYMISNTLTIKGTNEEYTDIIMDPSACIKATQYWGGYQQDGVTPVAKQGGGMIVIGNEYSASLIPASYDKARKKMFVGGVIDSNERGAFGTHGYVSYIMKVNNDVTDFDISGTVFMATNTTTGLSIGDESWFAGLTANGKGTSMDAYIHHIALRKYAWNSAADVNSNLNRASGILIHSSDNNFENIRVYYFKRNVKITEGSGNYFSEVHTLGPSSSAYNKDTSGFHIENSTNITLDKCYVDSDDYFLYVAPEAAGSIISVQQCCFYKYSGNGRSMTAFSLRSNQYNVSSSVAYNKITQLFVDGFSMTPSDAGTAEYKGIDLLSNASYENANYDYGTSFAKQVSSYNMSLERIRVVRPDKLVHGDLLKGAISGEKGLLLFYPTTMTRNGTTANSNWYRLCTIPVGYENGMIDYRVKIWLTGRYLEFPFSICRRNSGNHLKVNLGSKTIVTDDNQKYQFAFTNSTMGSLASYTMHFRLMDTAATITRGIKRIEFESSTAITPSPSRTQGTSKPYDIYTTIPYSADIMEYNSSSNAMAVTSPVQMYDAGDMTKYYPCVIINCSEKKMAFGAAATL